MTIMVLVVLAAIWAGVLLPPYLQKRRATRPSSSVVDFHQQLAVLQRTGRALGNADLQAGYANPRAAQPPQLAHHAAPMARPYAGMAHARMSRNDVIRRRRDVFTTLVCAALLTFVLALALGGSVWLFHLLVDAALLGYVALLLQIQQQRQHAAMRENVRYLPRQQSATQQALVRRQAN